MRERETYIYIYINVYITYGHKPLDCVWFVNMSTTCETFFFLLIWDATPWFRADICSNIICIISDVYYISHKHTNIYIYVYTFACMQTLQYEEGA